MKKIHGMVWAFVICLVFSGVAMAEKITVVGTGSGMALLDSVGQKFSDMNPGIEVIVPKSIGSSGGIKSVGTDKSKIGRIARPIKDKEKHYGLSYIPFAKTPIVFFVNKSAGATDLTPDNICDIYSGKIKNWKEVGGSDGRIRVIRREDGDSSLKVLKKSFPGFKDITITTKSKTTFNDQETLRFAEAKQGAIAFGTYGNARNHDLTILRISGKSPTDDDYPYNGVLALILKKENNTGNIKKFVDFATSPDAHETIRQAGGLPY